MSAHSGQYTVSDSLVQSLTPTVSMGRLCNTFRLYQGCSRKIKSENKISRRLEKNVHNSKSSKLFPLVTGLPFPWIPRLSTDRVCPGALVLPTEGGGEAMMDYIQQLVLLALSMALVQVQSGGVAILCCPLAALPAMFPVLLSLLLSLCHRVAVSTCRRKAKHRIAAPTLLHRSTLLSYTFPPPYTFAPPYPFAPPYTFVLHFCPAPHLYPTLCPALHFNPALQFCPAPHL